MEDTAAKILSLIKRRGFVFPSSEIYGGFGGFFDFGPLGTELKNNIKKTWWKALVQKRDDIVGLDSSIIMSPRIWEASGHTTEFSDPLSECKTCHKRFRADHLMEKLRDSGELKKLGFTDEEVKDTADINQMAKVLTNAKCPDCGGEMALPRKFNLMFRTFVGPVEDNASLAYLRPETAQGIFASYKNIIDTQRVKLPFGIAQIGKAFRNEITPGNFIFRSREFEQMELEYFVKPGEDDKAFEYWTKERMRWYVEDLGLKEENLRFRPHRPDELAHYAKACVDVEYKFPWGWSEIEGIANRRDFDLGRHQKFSGTDLKYFDETDKSSYVPFVIEPSCGVERLFFAVLCDSFEEIQGGRAQAAEAGKEAETILRFTKNLAPIKVAVLPLLKNKPELVGKAKEIHEMLKKIFMCKYDETGSIGRRYRRLDEVGVPYAVTVDFETLQDNDVTLRDRDTMQQERVKIADLAGLLKEKFGC
ncbi:MAG: glycine--tRNA ligase [Candidatus Paceibacterota bacterium]|jgi:glycyl-tRNA synthetase